MFPKQQQGVTANLTYLSSLFKSHRNAILIFFSFATEAVVFVFVAISVHYNRRLPNFQFLEPRIYIDFFIHCQNY